MRLKIKFKLCYFSGTAWEALPTMNCLQHWSLDRARQKQQAAILENEGISRQVRALATQIHGGHLLHWQKVIDCALAKAFTLPVSSYTWPWGAESQQGANGSKKRLLPAGLLRKSHSGGQWLLAEGQLQALSKLAISRQVLPSPLPSLGTGSCMLCTPSSAEHSAQTTEPLCPLRAGMRTSLGSATKINLKPSGEGAARALEKVKAVPM